MARTTTVQTLAKLSDLARRLDGRLEVSYRKGNRTGTLTQMEWRRLPSGKPTKREVACLDKGRSTNYDKSYEVEVTAFTLVNRDGHRVPLPVRALLD